MNRIITIEEAQQKLPDLIDALNPGDELLITSNGEEVARLKREIRHSWPCQPGSARETRHWMAPDFDAPLEDFAEYIG